LLLINLKDPDYYGHVNNWSAYLNSIKKSDEYVFKLWNTIQQDPEMAGKTTLFVTNDHGRHTSNFQHHGDDCQGCRHIMFYAMGPDFKKNVKLSVNRSLIDIHATISELMNLSNYSQGNIMTELFK
jgi:phosphopentomutase